MTDVTFNLTPHKADIVAMLARQFREQAERTDTLITVSGGYSAKPYDGKWKLFQNNRPLNETAVNPFLAVQTLAHHATNDTYDRNENIFAALTLRV